MAESMKNVLLCATASLVAGCGDGGGTSGVGGSEVLDTQGEGEGAHYSGRRINLEVKDAALGNILSLLAEIGKVDIVLAPGVPDHKVTINLWNTPWDRVLEVLVRATGLRAEHSGNVIRVYPRSAN